MEMTEVGLKISFEYLSGNDILFGMIKQIADRYGIRGYLERKDDTVDIIVSAPLEKLQEFSKELGSSLPYSIFMSDASTEVVEGFTVEYFQGFKINTDRNILPQNLSTCPNCLKELFDENSRRFYFPFISCSYCGGHYSYLYQYPFKRENTVFKFFHICEDCRRETEDKNSFRFDYPLTGCHNCTTPIYLKKGENERYGFDSEKTAGAVNTAVGVLKKGNLLKTYTFNGTVVLSLPTDENIQKIRQHFSIKRRPLTLLFTGIDPVKSHLVLSEEEIKAIASQEKPVLYARPSEKLEIHSKLSPFSYVLAVLPYDPVLLMLSAYLREEGIQYLLIHPVEDEFHMQVAEFELGADLPVLNRQKPAKIILLDKYRIIEEGEMGILPNIIRSKPTGNLSIAGDYAVLDLGEGEYLIDRKEKILYQIEDFVDSVNTVYILEDRWEDIKVPYSSKKGFLDYQGALYSVVAEHRKLDQPFVGIYLSTTSDNTVIAVKSHTKPLYPVIKVAPIRVYPDIKQTVSWVVRQISESSEAGEKLVKNIKSKFPHLIEDVELSDTYRTVNSIIPVFNVVSYLLELFLHDVEEYPDEPYQYLRDRALTFQGKKGVRIDYLLEESGMQFFLNWRKIVQSVLSYRLAEADVDMIAYSVIEGFADWVISETSLISSKLKIQNTVTAGNMLADPVLGGKLINAFSKNGKLLMNRKLPVDRQNIAFGGIFIQEE
ncbi:hypothetical protein [Persephonella sp.]